MEDEDKENSSKCSDKCATQSGEWTAGGLARRLGPRGARRRAVEQRRELLARVARRRRGDRRDRRLDLGDE